jgi:hypothetical protein
MSPEQFAALLQAVTSDTTWKIVLGGALALIGGFLAKVWDEWRAIRTRRRAVLSFAADLLESYASTFSELVEFQGQTGTIWIVILDRMLEEAPVFARNREHLILVKDTQLRRDIQAVILKVHSTANLLKAAVADEIAKRAANAPAADTDAATKMTRHRFDQLRDRIDQARDLRQRLANRR